MLILLGYVLLLVFSVFFLITNKSEDAISKIYKITVFYILNFVSNLMSYIYSNLKGRYAF